MQLDATLFPTFVRMHAITFDPERDGTGDIAMPPALGRAVPKRRAEFAAGRRCAREALRALAPELAGIEVGIGSQREPLFPAAAVGTISHARGIAAAAVAPSAHATGIGLDIEYWVADSREIDEQVLVGGEAARLATQTGWAHTRVATFVFSAKESLYKSLFPSVQTYFDFQDAELVAIDPRACTFEARLRVPLAGGFRAGETFAGRFALADEYVVTALLRERGAR
jgi:enterobactin synthetase component D